MIFFNLHCEEKLGNHLLDWLSLLNEHLVDVGMVGYAFAVLFISSFSRISTPWVCTIYTEIEVWLSTLETKINSLILFTEEISNCQTVSMAVILINLHYGFAYAIFLEIQQQICNRFLVGCSAVQ